jgi:hypothetical protein
MITTNENNEQLLSPLICGACLERLRKSLIRTAKNNENLFSRTDKLIADKLHFDLHFVNTEYVANNNGTCFRCKTSGVYLYELTEYALNILRSIDIAVFIYKLAKQQELREKQQEQEKGVK